MVLAGWKGGFNDWFVTSTFRLREKRSKLFNAIKQGVVVVELVPCPATEEIFGGREEYLVFV